MSSAAMKRLGEGDMKLAYHILSSGVHVVPLLDDNAAFVQEMLQSEKNGILVSEKIVADNVAQWYADDPRNEFDLTTDIPNWSPPFENMWIEWQQPDLHINS